MRPNLVYWNVRETQPSPYLTLVIRSVAGRVVTRSGKKQQIAETYRRIDNKQHGKWHADRTMNDVTDMPSIERIWSKNCLIAKIHWQRSGWNVMRQEINLIKCQGFLFVFALTVIDIHIISVQGRIYEDNWPTGFPELGKQINLLPYNPSFWERCRDETFRLQSPRPPLLWLWRSNN